MEQNQTTTPFIVTRDGEVDEKLSTIPKTGPLQEVKRWTSMQAEMFIYDLLHGTNYRKVRNDLIREAKNKAFEQRLGLIRK